MRIIKDSEFEKRMQMIKSKMAEHRIDVMFIYSDIWRTNNVAYFTDYRTGAGGIQQS